MVSLSWTSSVLCETSVPHGTVSLKSQLIVSVMCGQQELLLLVCLFGTQDGRVTCCVVELVQSVACVSVWVLAGFQPSAPV